jgi:hypothetical protein
MQTTKFSWHNQFLAVTTLGSLLLATVALAQPIQRQSLRGHVPAAVAYLTPMSRLAADRELNLAIGLPLRNQEELTNLLQRIYDPSSPDYHHYLTSTQFAEMFGPTKEDYQAVMAFAITNGLQVTMTHSNRTLLDVTGSVSNIEKAFHVTLRTYQHPRENRLFYAPDVEPTLDMMTPVLHISGLDNYIHPHPMSLRKSPLASSTGAAATGSGPGGAYLGNDFRAAYIPGLTLTGTGQSVGLLEFDSGYYQSDVTNYEGLAGLPNVPVKAVLLDGYDGGPGGGNDEVSLDIEVAIAMAPGLSSVIVYEGSTTDDILNRMATDNLAKQLGASWTYGIDAVSDQIFLQFAAQGQSFFNASGDSDAYVTNIYPPATPTDDPNITCVGGTTLTTSGPGGAWVSETVWNWDVEYAPYDDGIGTGGGISITYPIPTWQLGVSMVSNHGSTTYRNIPDVALTADNVFVVYDDGASGSFGGTSCATPLWAAFVALVNEQAVANGRPTLGFINPAIYALGKSVNYNNCFHDIVTGNNTWSESPANFYAVTGYDLCTGWGTPRGSNLVNQLAPPDPLQISPVAGVAFSGGVGGPLTPASQTYTLTNGGSAALDWVAGANVPWLNVSLDGGTLTPGGTAATVIVSLNTVASNLLTGTYATTLSFTNLTDGSVQGRAFSLTIIKPPVITTQPTGLIVIGGATATFTAGVAGGLPLNCQWQCNGTNLTDGVRVSGSHTNLTGAIYGSTISVLTISNVTAADGGNYSLVVSNAAGVAVSSNAVLTITPSGPVIISQPASQTVLVGATVQLAVTVDGTAPFSYQWKQNGTNLVDGGAISGSVTPILTINGASSANIGTYNVVVSNAIGTVTSTGAVLTVEAAVTGGQLVQNGGFETGSFSSWGESGNFADCSVSSGSPALHSGHYGALLGPAGSLGYLSQSLPTVAGQVYLISLWLDSPDGISPNEFTVDWNGAPIFDETDIGAIGWTNLQFYVTAIGTNTVLQFGFQDDESFLGLDDIQVTPLVSADGPPIIVTQPANQVALVGSNAIFSVLSSGRLPLFYQWQFDATNIPNATNATLVLANLTTNQTGTYDVLITNSLGSATSSNALLTVLSGSPAIVTFDDLTGSGLPVPVDYNGLTWSNFYYLDGVTYGQPSGYTAGTVSSPNVAFNNYGTPATISSSVPFDILSAYMTAAWNDNLQVEVKGYNNASLIYDNTYILSATAPTLIQFNYLGVTSVQFISSGGTPHPGYGGSGEQFVLDNVSLLFPPSLPVITTQPVNQTVAVGGAATFSVAASGTAPLSYFWSRNGLPITGATTSSYTTNNVQLSDSGSQFSCVVSNAYGTVISSNATLTVVAGPVFLTGNYLYLPIQINGVFLAANTGAKYNSAGTGGASGVDFWEPGTPVYNYIVGVGGTNYVNGSAPVVGGFTSVTVSNLSSGTLQRALISGVVIPGFSFTRDISFATDSKIIQIVDTLQNTSATALTNVVTLDTADPDQDSVAYGVSATLNDVVSVNASNDMVIATGPDTGLSVGFGSDSGFQIPSAAGFNNINAYSYLTVVDPNGAEADIDINLAQNYGTLAAGQSQSVVWYTVFGNSKTEVTNTFASFGTNPPSITSQPVSVTVPTGNDATFTVGAIGAAPLSYFWQRNSVFINGGTNSTYTTNNVQLTDSGSQFSCVVSNAFGTTNSQMATLTVVALPPSITQQPVNQTVPVGGTASFSVTATGNLPLSYFWMRNGTAIAGATNSIYTTNNVQLTDSGSQFSCLVSNAYGSTNSSNAVLTVVSRASITNVAFVHSSVGDPWGSDDDEVALTTVFGANWQTNFYETVNPAALFSPSNTFIFMEGSDDNANAMATFLNNNLAAMQNWVSNGGSLFLNAAPNQGGNINFGFGVTLIYGVTFTSSAEAVNPAAPIFNGPFFPVGTNWTGDSFAHATISGTGLNPLIENSINNLAILAETSAGLGHVLFGGMTLPHFHSPQPQADNLLANILSYGASQTVLPPTLDHFTWNAIAATQGVGTPFQATITVWNAVSTVATNFNGTVGISASGGGAATLYNFNFESGLQGFVIDNTFGSGNGLWHLSTGRAYDPGHSPTNSLYYGQGESPSGGGNYDNGTNNGGVVISPALNLPAAPTTITLSFNYLMNVEALTNYDLAYVEVSTNNGLSYTPVAVKNTFGGLTNLTSGLWVSNTVDISAFAGYTIKLRFRFDTVDAVSNDTEGWYLDDIIIRGSGIPIVVTPTSAGPFVNGVWTGELAVQQAGSNVVLMANDGAGHTGSSNPFNVVPGAGTTNLVQNGGFETGDFSGWTTNGNFTSTFVATNSAYAHSGTFGASLGPVGSLGFLSQTLATTSGTSYLLSLWLDSPNGSAPNEFSVSWNGNTFFDQTNLPAIGWTNIQLTVTATGTSTVLQFGFRDDPSFLGLDDISVVASQGAVIAPVFHPVILTNGQLILTWNTVSNGVYQLQYKTNLLQTNWVNIGGTITASNTILSATNPINTDNQRFYRVQQQ